MKAPDDEALVLLAELAPREKDDAILHALELASGMFAVGATQEGLDAAIARRRKTAAP